MPFRDLPGVSVCRFQKGDFLIRSGDPVEYVYYLISGSVHREWLSASGRVRIMNSKVIGNVAESIVGIILLFEENDNVCMYDFIASEDCECYRIPAETCVQYMRQSTERMEEVVRASTSEYAKLIALFQAKDERCSASRLCSMLLEWSQPTEYGLVVPKTWSNIKIAKFLSVHTVTVARILGVLKTEGIVERTSHGLWLKNETVLQQYAENEVQLKYR